MACIISREILEARNLPKQQIRCPRHPGRAIRTLLRMTRKLAVQHLQACHLSG
jgi:hypothetical protein